MSQDSQRHVRDAIAAHFAGAVAPAGEREMRAHLPLCDACHAHYEQHLLLSTLDPAGLPREVRLARGLGLRPERVPRRFGVAWLGLCGAAVAALAIVYSGGGLPGRGGGAGSAATTAGSGVVTSRGGPASVAAARSPEVQIYRFAHGARRRGAERAGDVVHPGDELAFAYRNPAGKGRLLVFAVDEHGHIYWYHPAWSNAAQNPTAVQISAEPGLHELPAAVLHKFDGERIMVHALFTDRELSVRQIESAVAEAAARDDGAGATAPLALPGATDVVHPLRIVR
ncbi:MAG TPA: hypothetical protein VFH68_11860 [Polyangia bacterium]|nr:hypothetical protein [Polyangia bacterium]